MKASHPAFRWVRAGLSCAALMLAVVALTTLPAWASALLWSCVFILLSLAILPRAKGLFIAILWQTRAPGNA